MFAKFFKFEAWTKCQQNAFHKLKKYLRILYRKTIFLDGTFLTC